ncbi:MAG: hypothetical protein DMG57_43085 [Acidobacteria bacterium]|nr:MAG: hypothetical protein DMG57_43085 [Acidobacteriota bacterium]
MVDNSGLGATTFGGSLTFSGTGANALNIPVTLQLASPQPPYFTGQQAFGLTPQGPEQVSLPNGTTSSQGSNQVLVFLSVDATAGDMQTVTSVLAAASARTVGEIPQARVLQVEVQNTNGIANLLTVLRSSPGVLYAGPNLFVDTPRNAYQTLAWNEVIFALMSGKPVPR